MENILELLTVIGSPKEFILDNSNSDDDWWKTIYERVKSNLAALESEINNKKLDQEKKDLYKIYYLTLKKELRDYEEAMDEIKYGDLDIKPRKHVEANKENELDLIGDEDSNQNKNSKNASEEKNVNLLDLDVDLDALDVPVTSASQGPVFDQNLINNNVPVRQEAFDFLGDKPSEDDFINLLK